MKIILASESLSRKKLLEKIGITFETIAPQIDEEIFHKEEPDPYKLCLLLAKKKNEKVYKQNPDAIIIAADQMVLCEGKLYGKPHTQDKAIESLMALQGRTHELINGLHMRYQDKHLAHSSCTRLKMRQLSRNQIEDYVKKDQPLKSAGSYYIEKQGLALFEKIDSPDFSSILGLPVCRMVTQLIDWGVPLFGTKT